MKSEIIIKLPLRYRKYLRRSKRLTYILAGRCTDGVVMVADRRLSEVSAGLSFSEINKIIKCKDVIIGSAGLSGISNIINLILSERIGNEAKELKKITTIEDAVKEGHDRYRERLIEKIPFEIEGQKKAVKSLDVELPEYLVSFKDENGKIKLYHVYPQGWSELIAGYRGIGSGSVYGEILVKKVWEGLWKLHEVNKEEYEEPTMMKMAPFLLFAVLMVSATGVDEFVGDNVNIWFYPDNGEPNEITESDGRYKEIINELQSLSPFVDLGQYLEIELKNAKKSNSSQE